MFADWNEQKKKLFTCKHVSKSDQNFILFFPPPSLLRIIFWINRWNGGIYFRPCYFGPILRPIEHSVIDSRPNLVIHVRWKIGKLIFSTSVVRKSQNRVDIGFWQENGLGLCVWVKNNNISTWPPWNDSVICVTSTRIGVGVTAAAAAAATVNLVTCNGTVGRMLREQLTGGSLKLWVGKQDSDGKQNWTLFSRKENRYLFLFVDQFMYFFFLLHYFVVYFKYNWKHILIVCLFFQQKIQGFEKRAESFLQIWFHLFVLWHFVNWVTLTILVENEFIS